MLKTKMWRIFFVAIGVGLLTGVLLYGALYATGGDILMHPGVGVPVAAGVGLLLGFGYYLFFKATLRVFTRPFLQQAQALVARPIEELPPVWASNEIDKLNEILTEALATLERLDTFSAIAKEIVAPLDPERTLGHIVGTAVESLPADSGLIFLLDEESQRYTVQASYLLPVLDDQADQIAFPAGEGVPGWVTTKGGPIIITNAQQDQRVHPLLRQEGVQSLLSVPLSCSGQTIGVLNLFNIQQQDAFDDNDLRLASIYADLAAVAIDNARLFAQAEDERSRLSAILSDTTDAVLVLDQMEQITLMNPAAEMCLGVSAAQLAGQTVAALGMDDLTAALEAARQSADPVVRQVVTPQQRTLYASVSPVKDVGWVMVMQDITPLKELERLRTEWVAAVSHDLKNPITGIKLAVGLMSRAGSLNDRQQEILERAKQSAEHLQTLVTDVLDLARLEIEPTLQAGTVNLAQLVASSVDEVQAQAAAKAQRLRVQVEDELPQAWGDGALLERVLVNLLSNAVKYTPAEGEITVRARSENGSLRVEVQDNGRGIPAESLPRLFDRFYRVPGSESVAEGTGLGLSVVKSIVEKHGGRIWVDSQVGQGSTFSFTVPAAHQGA